MAYLTNRVLTPERMDEPNVDPAELARSLRFIRRVNRHLGGASSAIAPLKRWTEDWPREREIRLLDIGAGLGDIPLAIVEWARARHLTVRITAIDLHEKTLAFAREHIGDCEQIELVQADARLLTDRYEPGSFDFAHAGMMLHHLPDIEVVTVLRIMDRLAAHGTIWNDLLRNTFGRIGAWLLTRGAPEMVQHDAQVSVMAGFTCAEALELATRAGWPEPQWKSHLGYRFALTSAK